MSTTPTLTISANISRSDVAMIRRAFHQNWNIPPARWREIVQALQARLETAHDSLKVRIVGLLDEMGELPEAE